MSDSNKHKLTDAGKKYTAPVLYIFGKVSQLTTGGTGKVFESGDPQGDPAQSNKHP